MCSVAAALSLAFVRTGTLEVIAYKVKSILSCSTRLSQIVWLMRCFCSAAQAAPTAGFLTPHNGLESVRAILTAQAQGSVHSDLTQTRLFNELHHANTLAVHADDLLATFAQHFLGLLTSIFSLHLLFTQTSSISTFINRAWSICTKTLQQ
jgi:hypothetical protein